MIQRERSAFASSPVEYSHLYLAIEKELAAVICIEDPLRERRQMSLKYCENQAFAKIVMMTGTASTLRQRLQEESV